MFCSKCGNDSEGGVNFCRSCGVGFQDIADEFAGKGIADIFIGDGFLLVAIVLSSTQSLISSLAWLTLLIPAFYFFGKGLSSILKAKQIRQRRKEQDQLGIATPRYLAPQHTPFIETLQRTISGELVEVASVTDRTTRDL